MGKFIHPKSREASNLNQTELRRVKVQKKKQEHRANIRKPLLSRYRYFSDVCKKGILNGKYYFTLAEVKLHILKFLAKIYNEFVSTSIKENRSEISKVQKLNTKNSSAKVTTVMGLMRTKEEFALLNQGVYEIIDFTKKSNVVEVAAWEGENHAKLEALSKIKVKIPDCEKLVLKIIAGSNDDAILVDINSKVNNQEINNNNDKPLMTADEQQLMAKLFNNLNIN